MLSFCLLAAIPKLHKLIHSTKNWPLKQDFIEFVLQETRATDPTLIHQHHLISISPQKLNSKYKMHKQLHTESQNLFYPPVSSLCSENLSLCVFIYKCHRQAYTHCQSQCSFLSTASPLLSTAHKGTCSPSRVWITYHHVHWASALCLMKDSTFVPACHNSCFTAICFLLFHRAFCSGFSSLSCVPTCTRHFAQSCVCIPLLFIFYFKGL